MSAGAADRFKAGQYKHWGMEHLGTKANLPDILANLLPSQIQKIDIKLEEREKIAQRYEIALSGTKIKFPKINSGIIHSRHLFPIHVGSINRDYALLALGEANIGATVNYRAVTSMDFYKNKYRINEEDFPMSKFWGEGTLSIPLFPGMTEDEQSYVITILLEKIDKKIGI
jgi:UDP-4-amino-4-deoxy-L-arabinose-oxoglutarate aminotransferase